MTAGNGPFPFPFGGRATATSCDVPSGCWMVCHSTSTSGAPTGGSVSVEVGSVCATAGAAIANSIAIVTMHGTTASERRCLMQAPFERRHASAGAVG